METTLYLDDGDYENFKEKVKKLGKYKKDVLTQVFFNYAFLKNSCAKWYKVTIKIEEFKKD